MKDRIDINGFITIAVAAATVAGRLRRKIGYKTDETDLDLSICTYIESRVSAYPGSRTRNIALEILAGALALVVEHLGPAGI
jgi:hypothetical protein